MSETRRRGPLLALRADMLMATGDAGAVRAYREELSAALDPAQQRPLLPRLARAATFAGDYATAAEALEGLEPDGSADDAALLLARGNLAYFTGDLVAAEAAADEARRRLAFADLGDWRLYDLITLQGLIAHLRGEWFSRPRWSSAPALTDPTWRGRCSTATCAWASTCCTGRRRTRKCSPSLPSCASRRGDRACCEPSPSPPPCVVRPPWLSGDLALAEIELIEAAELHHDIGSTAGEAHSLQRLAEVRLAQGDRGKLTDCFAGRCRSPAGRRPRCISATRVRDHDPRGTGCGPARAVVDQAMSTVGQEDACPFCSIMLAVPAAIACADAGDIDDARHHLAMADVPPHCGREAHGRRPSRRPART